MTLRDILVATDFSPASRPALRRAIEMAREAGARLWIAHVAAMPVLPGSEGYFLPQMYDDLNLAIRTDAKKRLERLTAAARKAGVRVSSLLLDGIPHEALHRAARRHHADLLVMGTHGRTGVARLFVGSVAARVVATAPRPVLTVRAAAGAGGAGPRRASRRAS